MPTSEIQSTHLKTIAYHRHYATCVEVSVCILNICTFSHVQLLFQGNPDLVVFKDKEAVLLFEVCTFYCIFV